MVQQAGILASVYKMVVPLLLSLSFVLIAVDATCLNPSILYAPREVVAKKGDYVSLPFWMQNEGDESCDVTWFKFDDENRLRPLPSYEASSWSRRVGELFVMSTKDLNLRNVQSSATYRGKVQNGGFVDIHLRVVLSDDDIPDLGERTIVYLPRIVHVNEGDNVGIICLAKNDYLTESDPFIENWYKLDDNYEKIRLDETGGRYGGSIGFEYGNHMEKHILVVLNVTKPDAGTYRCQLDDEVFRDTHLVVSPADSD